MMTQSEAIDLMNKLKRQFENLSIQEISHRGFKERQWEVVHLTDASMSHWFGVLETTIGYFGGRSYDVFVEDPT